MKFSKDDLISLFKQLENEIGKQPTKKEWKRDPRTPSDMPVRKNFGNWNNFVIACGGKPVKPKFNKKARINSANARRGKPGGNNKGGRIINKYGYVEVWLPNHPNANSKGYILEHRLVMSNHLNRTLLPHEDVHHINEDKQDNSIENLKVLSRSEHARLHEGPEKHRRKNAKPCVFRECGNMTSSKYGLCNKHYRLQWQRMEKGLITDISDLKEIPRGHSEETKKKISEAAKKQPRRNGRFSAS